MFLITGHSIALAMAIIAMSCIVACVALIGMVGIASTMNNTTNKYYDYVNNKLLQCDDRESVEAALLELRADHDLWMTKGDIYVE